MKNKMKVHWGLIGVFVGTIISKVVSSYFGLKGREMAMDIVMLIFILIVLYLATKNLLAAAFMFIMGLPLIVAVIGVYFNNMFLLFGGIFSIFIVIPISIKIMPYFKNK